MDSSNAPLYVGYGCLLIFIISGLNLYFGDLTPREIKGGYLTMASMFITGVMMLVIWKDAKEDA